MCLNGAFDRLSSNCASRKPLNMLTVIACAALTGCRKTWGNFPWGDFLYLGIFRGGDFSVGRILIEFGGKGFFRGGICSGECSAYPNNQM